MRAIGYLPSKRGKGKLPLFRGNREWVIPIYGLGTMYHPERAYGDHELQSSGRSQRRTLIPGGAMRVRSYLKCPNTCSLADNLGLIREGQRRLRVMTYLATNLHHKLRGEF